jgi:fatty acid desaturase
MRWVTTAVAVEVAATGVVLLLSPALFGRLIFGDELSDPGQALGRLTGIALLGFALTSWPDPSARSIARAMLTYNLLATIYLGYLGILGTLVGVLLWPAVVLHLLFAVLLAAERARDNDRGE